MRYRISFVFFVFFSCLSVMLFSQNIQKESKKSLVLDHLDTSYKIMLHAPELIKEYIDGRLYLDDSQICQDESEPFLDLNNGEVLFLPPMSQDSRGFYLVALSIADSKMFKCHCNNCNHEWAANVWDVQCPRCGSTNFSVLPNW